MTKKDYELIAGVINNLYSKYEVLEQYHRKVDEPTSAFSYKRAQEAVHQVALDLGLKLKNDNDKFDRDKFYRACGIN